MRRTLLILAAAALAVGGGWTGARATDDAPSAPPPDAVALRGHDGPPGYSSWTPWPQAMHDAQHGGASEAVGPRQGLVRWSRRLEGDVTPGPVIGRDGTIYAASNGGVLHALDPATGKDRWTYDGGAPYGSDLSTSPGVLPDGTILWPGPMSTLFALSPAGRLLWRLDLGSAGTSPAITVHGKVTLGTDSGVLFGLLPTPKGPAVQWRVDLDDHSYGSPAWSSDESTVYQTVDSSVVAVRDGDVLWRTSAPTEIIEVSPAVAPDGTVVIGTNDPYQYGLDPRDGSVRWKYARDEWTYSSPTVTQDGIAYFGDHRNRVTGVDSRTGELLFRYQGAKHEGPGGIGVWTSVLVDAQHSVYAGTRSGDIYGVDRQGRLMWQITTGATVDSYPALTADGALIIGVADGRLLAIADD